MNMRQMVFSVFGLSALVAIGAAGDPSPEKNDSAVTVVAGVPWHTSIEAAMKRAKREGKPILHMQMFGKLDEEFC